MAPLLQVVLVWQVSLDAEDIRNEKVKVLRNMSPIRMEDVVIGQYRGRGKKQGYLDDKTVPDGRCAPLLPLLLPVVFCAKAQTHWLLLAPSPASRLRLLAQAC